MMHDTEHTMVIITTANDIRTWVSNNSPANVYEAAPERIGDVAEAIRTADGRPAWGEDWQAWLDENAERITIETLA